MMENYIDVHKKPTTYDSITVEHYDLIDKSFEVQNKMKIRITSS